MVSLKERSVSEYSDNSDLVASLVFDVLSNAKKVTITSLVAAIALSSFLLMSGLGTNVYKWMAAIVVMTAVRFLLVSIAKILHEQNIKKSILLLVISQVLAGLVWGWAIFIVGSNSDALSTYIILLALTGVVTGAVTTNVSYPLGAYSFVVPLLISLFVWVIINDTDKFSAIVFMAIIYTVLLSYLVSGARKKVVDTQVLYLENMKMRDALSSALSLLADSETIKEKIISSIPDSIFIVNAAGFIVQVNDFVETIFGYKEDEIVGKKIEVLIPPEIVTSAEHDVLREKFHQEKDDRPVIAPRIIYARHKDGHNFPVEIGLCSINLNNEDCIMSTVRDLTEREYLKELERESTIRKQAEEQKASVLNNYEALISALGELTYEHNIQQKTILWSGAYSEILGYDLSEMGNTESDWLGRIHSDDLANVKSEIERAETDGKIFELEYRFRDKDGKYLWFHDRGIFIVDEDSMVAKKVGVMKNITTTKNAIENLEESQKLLTTVLNTIPYRVFWKDLNGTYLGVNRSFANDAGKSDPNDIVGKDDYGMIWADRAKSYREDDRLVISSGKSTLLFEEKQTTPDGKILWLETSKVPLTNVSGEIIGVLGAYNDITERKANEEQLNYESKSRSALAEMLDISLHENSEMKLALKILETISRQEFLGIHSKCALLLFIDNESESYIASSIGLNKLDEEFLHAIDLNELIYGNVVPVPDRECSEYNYFVPLQYQDDIIGCLVAYPINKSLDKKEQTILYAVSDILSMTIQRIRADSNLQLQNDLLELKVSQRTADLVISKMEAEKANKSKSVFLANMSHELRTPMHGILSFSSFGLEKTGKVSEEKVRGYFEQIQNSGNRLLALLNDLLDLAKLESGKMEIVFENYDIGKVIKSCVDEQVLRINEKDLRLTYDGNVDSNSVIEFDSVRIGQVITNLLSNSIKFCPDSGLIVIGYKDSTIHLDAGDEEALLIYVKDNGVGIPENELDKVFGKFMQSSKSSIEHLQKGTGLGLSISKEIIYAHNGKIWAECNPDAGVTFKILIPKLQKLNAKTDSV